MSGFLKIRQARVAEDRTVVNTENEDITYLDANFVRVIKPYLTGTIMHHDADPKSIGHIVIAKTPIAVVLDTLRARSTLDNAKQPIIVNCGCEDDDDDPDARDPSENEILS